MKPLRRRHLPPGSPPGHVQMPERPADHVSLVRVISYDLDRLDEFEAASIEEILPHLEQGSGVVWIDVVGLRDAALLQALGDRFGLHPLSLEDVVNLGQRPKLEEYPNYLFIVLRHLALAEELDSEQISLFLGPGYVLTFQERVGDCFEPVRQRVRGGRPRIRGGGSGYLAYALVDTLVDQFFPILETFGDRLEELEDELFDDPTRDKLEVLQQVKKELLVLRRTAWSQREVVSTFERHESGLVSGEARVYLRDCYDHAVQILDMVETYRDLASGLTDLYLSSLSHRMNEVMKVLTVIASIFIPLTFVAGIYGMNFDPEASPWNMPELQWYWGYPAFWVLMLVISGGLLYYFKRKDWL